jgi:hypothetical protein
MKEKDRQALAQAELDAYNAERAQESALWRDAQNGRFDEALAGCDHLLSLRDNVTLRLLRGSLRLLTGDMIGGQQDLEIARVHPGLGQSRLMRTNVGAALWMQGKREAACQDWAEEIRLLKARIVTHTDIAGGIEPPAVLWWASAHEDMKHWRKLAEKEMKARMKTTRYRPDDWPGPVAPYLLGETADDALLVFTSAEQSAKNPMWAPREAHFYTGARLLDRGDLSGYKEQMELAKNMADIGRTFFLLSGYELEHAPTP